MGKLSEACARTACADAMLVVRRQLQSSGRWARAAAIVGEFRKSCATPTRKLWEVAEAMTAEMNAGLASEGGSKVKMIISYVDNLPTGSVN